MNKIKLLPIVLLFISHSLKAQENNFISAGFTYKIGSSSVSNHFINSFLNSAYIDNTEKQHMFASLDKDNRFGAQIGEELRFQYIHDTLGKCKNFGFSVGLFNVYHVDMNLPNDLIRLMFSGNKIFEGQEADLSQTSFQFLQFQEFRMGVVKQHISKNAVHTFGFGLGFVNGTKLRTLKINEASIYTAQGGESIDIAANYTANISDTSSNKLFPGTGMGASLNFSYKFEGSRGNTFYIELSDLGKIFWNKNTLSPSKDTTIHFEGVQVDDILNIEGSIFGNANTDSLSEKYIYTGASKSISTWLPVKFETGFLHTLNKHCAVFAGVKKYFNSNYKTQLKAGCTYSPWTNSSFSANLNYGNYTNANVFIGRDINLGLEIRHIFADRFKIIIGSDAVNGYLFPNSVGLQNLYVVLSIILK
jgi:hypothetical protein